MYGNLRATATRLIRQYGKPADLLRDEETGPPYNPVVETKEHPVVMVETGYSMTHRNETLVQSGDKLGIISPEGEEPLLSDRIRIDGSEYSFIDVKPLNPGGTKLLFEFHARR